jgi:hypothetical protein
MQRGSKNEIKSGTSAASCLDSWTISRHRQEFVRLPTVEPCRAPTLTRVHSSKGSLSSVTIFVCECLSNGNASLTENLDRAFSIGLTKGYTT